MTSVTARCLVKVRGRDKSVSFARVTATTLGAETAGVKTEAVAMTVVVVTAIPPLAETVGVKTVATAATVVGVTFDLPKTVGDHVLAVPMTVVVVMLMRT